MLHHMIPDYSDFYFSADSADTAELSAGFSLQTWWAAWET